MSYELRGHEGLRKAVAADTPLPDARATLASIQMSATKMASTFSVATLMPSNSTIGHDVEKSAVLQVATRLQQEGLARLDANPES
jgi:hypothetical protein